MRKRRWILGWVGWGLAGLLPSPAWAAARLAILNDEKTQAAADLLVAEISAGKADVELVERTEIDRIRREHALGAQGSVENSLQIAGWLHADGLLALETVTAKDKPVLSARLVAAGPAVILGAAEWAVPTPPDPAGLARAVAAWMQPLTPKLSLPVADAVPLSLLNLRAPLKGLATETLEGPLTFLLSRQLVRQPRLLVLERWRLGEAAAEKAFPSADETAAFWRGSYIVDGEIVPAAGNAGPLRFHVKLFLRPPAGGGTGVRTLEADGTTDNLPEVAADLAGRIAREVGGNGTAAGGQAEAWQPQAEATQYLNEARWATHADLPLLAGPATEAAWALGNRDPDLYRLRVVTQSALAFPSSEGMDRAPIAIGYHTDTIDVRGDGGSHLRHALLALDAFENFLVQPFAAKPPRRIDCRSTLGSTALLAAARVLRNHYERGAAASAATGEELAELRAACRRTLAELLPLMEPDKELIGTWGPDLIEAIYLPFWSEQPEDACAATLRVLHREIPTRQRGNRYYANYSLLARGFPPGAPNARAMNEADDGRATPWLAGWHGETADALAARWEAFLSGLEAAPTRPTDPLDAAFLRLAGNGTHEEKAARLEVFKDRLWAVRDAVLAEERVHAYYDSVRDYLNRYEYERRKLDPSLNIYDGRKHDPMLEPGHEEFRRWMSYYLQHAAHDDYEFMLGVGLNDQFTAEEAAEFFRDWTAMKARLDASQDGWRTKTPAVTYSTMEARLLGRFPALAPPVRTEARAVKKLWLVPGLAETVAAGGKFEDEDVAWADGLLWVRAAFLNAGEEAGGIYALRLPGCEVAERVPTPPRGLRLPRHGNLMKPGPGPGRFQVGAGAVWLLFSDAVDRYDRKTRTWTETALPPDVQYTALQADESGGFYVGYTGHKGGDSGILHRVAQDGGRFDVLSSSRRRPRQNAMDDRPDYGVYEMFPGPGQSLGANIDLTGHFHDPGKGEWNTDLPGGPSGIWLTKTAARTLFFWHGFLGRIENAEPGRPVHWLWNEPPKEGKSQSERLAGDPGGVAQSHYMELEPFIAGGPDGTLWVTAPRGLSAGRAQALHRYDWADEKKAVTIPVDFQISEADRQLVAAATSTTRTGPEEPSNRLRLVATDAGLVFWDFGLPGFWLLPTADLEGAKGPRQ